MPVAETPGLFGGNAEYLHLPANAVLHHLPDPLAGLRALASWVEQSKSGYLVQNRLTYADLAAVSVLGFMAVRWPQHKWREQYPHLEEYWKRLEERPSFANTRPVAQKFTDPVV